MKYTEYYRCDGCKSVWGHEWDTDDYNNDYTCCPECDGFEFEDITAQEYMRISGHDICLVQDTTFPFSKPFRVTALITPCK